MNFQKCFAFISVLAFIGCSPSDDMPELPPEEGFYSGGILVLNEGNFGAGNASVSYLNPVSEEMQHEIYQRENQEPLGDVAQSIGFYNDLAFIVLNGSAKIVVADRSTFKKITTIETGLYNPRYITFSGGKAYVTNWGSGSDPEDDFVAVINTTDFMVEKKIPVAEGPEKLIAGSGRVYVAHAGGYNFNDVLSVIDPVKNDLITTIPVGDVPNSLLVDGSYLWVLAGGKPAYSGSETGGVLTKIDLGTHEVVSELSFPAASDHPANLEGGTGTLYYTQGNKVFAFDERTGTLPQEALFEMTELNFLYGFELVENRIYATSTSSDFTGNGNFVVYDLSGLTLGVFETGINPNGIFLN